MQRTKKILFISRNLPPLVGGMEKLNFHIVLALKNKFNLSVAGPKQSSEYHKLESFVEFSFKPLWKYVISSVLKATSLTLKIKPDVVICGSGSAILAGYVASRLCSAKLICYLHGLDIIASSLIYQSLFVPLIKRSDSILVNSNHTLSLAIGAGIDPQKISILAPGVSLPDCSDSEKLARQFRAQYGLAERPILLIAGRVTARKGIAEFIEHTFADLCKESPELMLVIIGEEAIDAMKASHGLLQSIHDKVSQLGLEENVTFAGRVDDRVLSSAFFAATVFVFPVLDLPNDVEGFGMVAIEAAAHGLPTVGFLVGGVADAIQNGKSGWLVDPGNYNEMKAKIISFVGPQKLCITKQSCKAFAEEFEWSKFGQKLEGVLEFD